MKKLEVLRKQLFLEQSPKKHSRLQAEVELVELKNPQNSNRCFNHNRDSDPNLASFSPQTGFHADFQNRNNNNNNNGDDPAVDDDDDEYQENCLKELGNSELSFSSSSKTQSNTFFSKFSNPSKIQTKSSIHKLNFKAISTLTFSFPTTHRERYSDRDRDRNRNRNRHGGGPAYVALESHPSEEPHTRQNQNPRNLEKLPPNFNSNLNSNLNNIPSVHFLISPEAANIYQSTTSLVPDPEEDCNFSHFANKTIQNNPETEPEAGSQEMMARYREEMSESCPLRGGSGDDELQLGQSSNTGNGRRFSIFGKPANRLTWTIFLSAMAVSVLLFCGILAAVLKSKVLDPVVVDPAENNPGNNPVNDGPSAGNIKHVLKLMDSASASGGNVPVNLVENVQLASTDEDFLRLEQNAWPIVDVRQKDEDQFRNQLHLTRGPVTTSTSGSSSRSKVSSPPVLKGVPIIIPIQLFLEADQNVVTEGLTKANGAQVERLTVEQQLIQLGFTIKVGSPASSYSIATSWTSEESQNRSAAGFMMDVASQRIAKILNLNKAEAREGIVQTNLTDFVPHPFCPSSPSNVIQCDGTSVYRSYDGSCNNLHHERWGASGEPYRRILLPDYADGITVPRVRGDGAQLPNPRKVSKSVIQSDPSEDPLATFMHVLWGQFVEHDLVLTAQSTGLNGTALACCNKGNLVKPQHPECLPITIPKDDPFYKSVQQSCLNMGRSAPAPICEFGPREQFNQLTAYLDASTLYGSTVSEYKVVMNKGPFGAETAYPGRLPHSYIDDGRPLPQRSVDLNDGCNIPERVEERKFCFKSGDKRVNEYLGITSMNLIWIRQHNLIAEHLVALNPSWDKARIFEESRRIVIAQIQHITYNEYLPVLIGPGLMHAAGLKLLPTGYYQDYDQEVDGTISNAFASAAFHVTDSMVQGLVKMVGPHWKNEDFIQLQKLFFNPFRLYDLGRLDAILRGHASLPAGRADLHFSPQVTEHYFQLKNSTFGLDLAAMDIQRGRDHGLPGYTEWRRACNLTAVNNFTDLTGIWSQEDIDRVATVYKSVEDVDLYIGGLAETSLPDAVVGPTFACILADQFLRLRKGDRFWYEGNIQLKPFTSAQLEVIRRTSLARVLCSNSDDLEIIQPLVMQKESTLSKNQRQSCISDQIPDLDYGPWKESTPGYFFGLFKPEPQSASNQSSVKTKETFDNKTTTKVGTGAPAVDSLEDLFSEEEADERFDKEYEKDNNSKLTSTFKPASLNPSEATRTAPSAVTKNGSLSLNRGGQNVATAPAKLEAKEDQNNDRIEFSQTKQGILMEWKTKRGADAGSRYRRGHEALPEQLGF